MELQLSKIVENKPEELSDVHRWNPPRNGRQTSEMWSVEACLINNKGQGMSWKLIMDEGEIINVQYIQSIYNVLKLHTSWLTSNC